MNVGYTSIANNKGLHANPVCPLCGSDVYGSKYGGDFTCVNKECTLNKVSAFSLIEQLKIIIKQL